MILIGILCDTVALHQNIIVKLSLAFIPFTWRKLDLIKKRISATMNNLKQWGPLIDAVITFKVVIADYFPGIFISSNKIPRSIYYTSPISRVCPNHDRLMKFLSIYRLLKIL